MRLIGGCLLEITHRGDAISLDRDIAIVPGCAGAVDDAGAGDDEIVIGLLGAGESAAKQICGQRRQIKTTGVDARRYPDKKNVIWSS